VPHLSELQKKYAGKVNVIGLNIWEEPKATDNSYFHKIDEYIAEMGDKMSYTVAADGYEGKMTKAWMEATDAPGIPTSFVVGKDGTVLYIGHPMGLDTALEQIVDGKYDLQAAAAKDKDRRESTRARREAMEPISKAMKAGDTKGAVAAIDNAVAKNPKLSVMLGMTKFSLLAKSDEPAAMAWAKTFAEGAARDDVNTLNSLAWMLVDDKTTLKNPDMGLAVQIAERGFSLAKATDPTYGFIGDTLAYALFKNGQLDRAIEVQGKAVASAEAIKDFPAPTLKEMRDRLETFRQKKKAGGGG
jgi:hypothetical protein